MNSWSFLKFKISKKKQPGNGDIIVTLYPLNDNCAWLTPATFKAHLVPEELMAQPLTVSNYHFSKRKKSNQINYSFIHFTYLVNC